VKVVEFLPRARLDDVIASASLRVCSTCFSARASISPLAIFRGAYAEGHRMDGKDGGKQERVFRRMFRRIELSHTLDRANFFGVAVSVADAFAGKRACDCGQRRGDMVEKILHGNDTQFGGVRLMGGVTCTPPVKDISRSESFDEDVPDGLGADLAYSLELLRLRHGIPQQHDERLGAEQLLHAVRGEFLFLGPNGSPGCSSPLTFLLWSTMSCIA
jgi:hypothetical protein